MNLFPTAFFLGLAGFDIAGVILIVTALSMKCTKRSIYVFSITSLITTISIGLLVSQILGTSIYILTKIFNYIPDTIYGISELLIGIVFLFWFIERVFATDKQQKEEEKKESFLARFLKKDMFIVGMLFSLWVVSDPSFWGIIALAAQSNNLFMIVLAFAVWMIIGQLPMYILVVAVMCNKQEKMIKWFEKRFTNNDKKDKKILKFILLIVILLAGMFFLIESIYYFITGMWIF